MMIYVVTGSYRDYDDSDHWLEKAFYDKSRAEEYAEELTRRQKAEEKVLNAWVASRPSWPENIKWFEKNPQPKMTQQKGTGYEVEEIQLVEFP